MTLGEQFASLFVGTYLGVFFFFVISLLGLAIIFFPVFVLPFYVMDKLPIKQKKIIEALLENEVIKFSLLVLVGLIVWILVPILGSYILAIGSEYFGINF